MGTWRPFLLTFLARFSAATHSGEGEGRGWINTDGDHQESGEEGDGTRAWGKLTGKVGDEPKSRGQRLMVITQGAGKKGHHGKYGKWVMLRAGGSGRGSKERDQGGGSLGRGC